MTGQRRWSRYWSKVLDKHGEGESWHGAAFTDSDLAKQGGLIHRLKTQIVEEKKKKFAMQLPAPSEERVELGIPMREAVKVPAGE